MDTPPMLRRSVSNASAHHNPATSPAAETSEAELRNIVRDQGAQIHRLVTDKNALLARLEVTETNLKQALEMQLKHATQEKDSLDNSMRNLSRDQAHRAEKFEKQIQELRTRSDAEDGGEDSAAPEVMDPLVESAWKIAEAHEDLVGNVADVKKVVKELMERVVEQSAAMKKLKFELEMEVGHVNILRSDNQALRQMTVALQASAEQEEEYISNKLLKRINNLKREKGELLIRVEQEEEMITNTLQKKLAQLQKEKVDMEIALEQEQEFIVNRLQKQLESFRQQQQPMSPNSAGSSSLKKWHSAHSPSSSLSEFPMVPSISPAVVEVLKAEVNSLRQRLTDMEKAVDDSSSHFRDLYGKLKDEVHTLRTNQGISTDDLEKTYPSVVLLPPPTVHPSNGLNKQPSLPMMINTGSGNGYGEAGSRSPSSTTAMDSGPPEMGMREHGRARSCKFFYDETGS
ncbi:hypothetical protein BJ742DRAFT_75160 [Cladochytrium replicatum]|nr:hypothetical protein BJ742DRAFT_75160 [Cladochytrium replicatum]